MTEMITWGLQPSDGARYDLTFGLHMNPPPPASQIFVGTVYGPGNAGTVYGPTHKGAVQSAGDLEPA